MPSENAPGEQMKAVRTDSAVLQAYTALFKALADETRLRIYLLLGGGEVCVCQIQVALGMPQAKISRHLTVLRHAGLVAARREGLWMYYSRAAPSAPSLRVFMELLAARLEADPGLMAAVVANPQYATLPLDEMARMAR